MKRPLHHAALGALLLAGAAPAALAQPVWQETTYTYDDTVSGHGLPATASVVDPSGPDLTTAFDWDAAGNLVAVTGPDGQRVTAGYRDDRRIAWMVSADQSAADAGLSEYDYDEAGRLVAARTARTVTGTPGAYTGADWATTSIAYTDWGKVESITDPAGDETGFLYYPNDLLLVEEDATGRINRYSYSVSGNMSCVRQYINGEASSTWRVSRRQWTDLHDEPYRWWNGNQVASNCGVDTGYRTERGYDAFYRQAQHVFPDGSAQSWTLDARENRTAETNRAGQVAGFVYDASSRLTEGNYADSRVAFEYDLAGRQTRALADDNTTGSYDRWVDYAYDFAGRIVSETQTANLPGGPLAFQTGYAYDAAGNRTAIVWPDGYVARYAYDGAGHLIEVCEDADGDGSCEQVLAHYEYDRMGRRTRTWFGGTGAASASSSVAAYYEADSDLSRLEHTFGIGSASERTVTFAHAYDGAGRLTATHVDEDGWVWSAGTLAFVRDYANDIETEGTDALDQVDGFQDTGGSTASVSYSYDDNGNLIAASGRLSVHNSRNQLTGFAGNTLNPSTGLPTGSSQTASMRYDASGRRVFMSASSGTDLAFIYADDMTIADIDFESGVYGGVLRRYIPGAAVDERVAMITVNPATGATVSREYYHANRLGSVIAMAGETGSVTAQYVYTPYGVESPYNASGNPYRYTGRRLDAAWGVHYYRDRYYDPQIGRFLETDPAWFTDSTNLYAYVGNNPLNATDPTGRQTWKERTASDESCDESCQGRLDQVDEMRRRMTYAVAESRDQADPVSRWYGENVLDVYDQATNEINEAATQFALTGETDSILDRADAAARVVGADALLNITASAGAIGIGTLSEVGGIEPAIGGIESAIGRAGVANPSGMFGPGGPVIGHPAALGRTLSFLRSGRLFRFGWTRNRGGFQLRRGRGSEHIDVEGAFVRARDVN